MLMALLLVVITAAFGRLFYNADIPAGGTLLRFAVMLIVGAAAFCSLGLAMNLVRAERRSRPRRGQRLNPPPAVPLGHLHPDR